MIFNPEESIDFHGFTGPFVQYTHPPICSILQKTTVENLEFNHEVSMSKVEKNLLKNIEQYPQQIILSAQEMNPAIICNTIYNIAKEFNHFLVNHSILKAESPELMNFRLQICLLCKHVISHGLGLLGIASPQRM